MKLNNKGKTNIVVIIVLVILLCVIAGLVIFILKSRTSSSSETMAEITDNKSGLTYEANLVTTSESDLQMAVDEMLQQVEDGYMALEMKTEATSADGETFACYLGNSADNEYDMYFGIYMDAEYTDEVYLSGLIPPGARVESFKSNKKLEPGVYSAYLVYTQVEDNHQEIHSQVVVTLSLIVSEP